MGLYQLLGEVAEVEQVPEQVEPEKENCVAFDAAQVHDGPAAAAGILLQLLDAHPPAFRSQETGLHDHPSTFSKASCISSSEHSSPSTMTKKRVRFCMNSVKHLRSFSSPCSSVGGASMCPLSSPGTSYLHAYLVRATTRGTAPVRWQSTGRERKGRWSGSWAGPGGCDSSGSDSKGCP